jgi:hypothetical protein
VELRADFYREMRHCRSLPENDEMLRILRAMQFLTILIHQAPARLAAENGHLNENLAGFLSALRAIENRLDSLPTAVSSSIGPEKIAASLGETLHQQFFQTTIPQTAAALSSAATELKRSVAQVVIAMDELHNRYDGAAIQARSAIKDIESSIASATRVAREATESLTRTLIHLHWTSVFLGALILFLAGFGLGMSFR